MASAATTPNGRPMTKRSTRRCDGDCWWKKKVTNGGSASPHAPLAQEANVMVCTQAIAGYEREIWEGEAPAVLHDAMV
jgi:hypothetical protein